MSWRVCKWENGASGTDFTEYLGAPIFYEDRLDERLDAGEFVLESMPTETYGKAFPPKTKFRIEYGNEIDGEFQVSEKYDVLVDHDDVEFYEGAQDICCHRVTFIEASVVAQGMHVDNIALTYKLQDVTLDYEVTDYSSVSNVGITPTIPRDQIHEVQNYKYVSTKTFFGGGEITFYVADFINSYSYRWKETQELSKIPSKVSQTEDFELNFTIPKLYCQGVKGSSWIDLFEVDTKTEVVILKCHKDDEPIISGTYTRLGGSQYLNDAILYNEEDSNNYFLVEKNTQNSNYGNIYITKYNNWKTIKAGILPGKPYISNNPTRDSDFMMLQCDSSPKYRTVSLTISALSEEERAQGYYLECHITCSPVTPNDKLITYYRRRAYAEQSNDYSGDYSTTSYISCSVPKDSVGFGDKIPEFWDLVYDSPEEVNSISIEAAGSAKITTSISSTSTLYPSINFLNSSVKYNAYEFLRKALLTVDTQIVDVSKNEGLGAIQYPIYVSYTWREVLKQTTLYEDMYDQKNLWEILIRIGYYLHAIPYLEFADDGTDRFMLQFKKLGSKTDVTEQKGNQRMTVFNSHNLSEYFAEFDAYATNMFSPQNIVEERIVAQTTDSTFLVSNNTAELITRFPILELIGIYATYHGEKNISNQEEDITRYVFEQSVYNILTASNPTIIAPAKGNSLYYSYGDNKITGLNYTAVSVNDNLVSAFKQIIKRVYGKGDDVVRNIKINDFSFRVVYRTQDSLRTTNMRPDLEKYVLNSSYEKYPHHEQFYGQQDKVVDSERFSANLFGQLLRVGNDMYQCQEYTNSQKMKRGGDLITISGEPYYVVECANEFYPEDIVLQKVTYSKNFNQLAQIVTIPSEPRFYEIAERSKIRREIRLNDFIKVTADTSATPDGMTFMGEDWGAKINALFFGEDQGLPKYAYTQFRADKTIPHDGNMGPVGTDTLFPSSSTTIVSENKIKPIAQRDYCHNIVPVQHYPMRNGIVLEWDMIDNFSAGDYVDPEVNNSSDADNADSAYYGLQPLRYVDIFGRADLFAFRLFTPASMSYENIQNLPRAQYGDSLETESGVIEPPSIAGCYAGLQSDTKYIGLNKDNREELSFNYQISLLHDMDFISYPNLFGKKEGEIKIAYLKDTQSIFENSIDMGSENIIMNGAELSTTIEDSGITIDFPRSSRVAQIGSIVLYVEGGNSAIYPILARNVDKLKDEEKLLPWRILPKRF